MKTPRIAVVVAAMKAERAIVRSCYEQVVADGPDELKQRLEVIDACLMRLEPNGADTKPDAVTKPRTRKPKPEAATEPTPQATAMMR